MPLEDKNKNGPFK